MRLPIGKWAIQVDVVKLLKAHHKIQLIHITDRTTKVKFFYLFNSNFLMLSIFNLHREDKYFVFYKEKAILYIRNHVDNNMVAYFCKIRFLS